jgi:hypothetical protein
VLTLGGADDAIALCFGECPQGLLLIPTRTRVIPTFSLLALVLTLSLGIALNGRKQHNR